MKRDDNLLISTVGHDERGKGAGRPFAVARCWEINDRPHSGTGPRHGPSWGKDLVAARPLAEPLAVVR